MLIDDTKAEELRENFLWHTIGSSSMNQTIHHKLGWHYIKAKRLNMQAYDYVDEVLDTRILIPLHYILISGRQQVYLCL